MNLQLGTPLSTYFSAQNAHDVDAMLACFADEARVHDEGRDMHGLAPIREWMHETTRKYRPTIRPTQVAEEGAQTVVTAEISGTFPGSPIELRYRFTLSGKQIASLEING